MPAFFFKGARAPRYLPSSPTRLSSDLFRETLSLLGHSVVAVAETGRQLVELCRRSEEHTSELQSQSNLVCRPFFLKEPAPPDISPLPLHDSLPISSVRHCRSWATRSSPSPRPAASWSNSAADRKSTRLNSSHSQISYAGLFF